MSVIVVAPDDAIPTGGALGWLVPGAGETVSGEGAYAALLRGKTQKSLLGGVPHGKPVIELGPKPGTTATIYVQLPQSGTQRNDRRYLVEIVGPGWSGILKSPS